MYKLSKFNYHCLNDAGELLLFNSYLGFNSMCKIKNKTVQRLFLENHTSLTDEILLKLVKKGIIVANELDEDMKLKSLITDTIASQRLGLTISPTEGCNFRCKYCYESHDNLNITNEVKENIIIFVRNNIHKYTNLHVSWFGGEPLLSLKTVQDMSKEFMKICNFNRRKYSSTMTTNGYLLDIDTFKTLLDCKINLFQISIDGIKTTHDYQRPTVTGKTTFDLIVKNLLEIKKLRERNFHIVIRSNVTKEIFNDLDEYIDLISSICENDNRFSVMINFAAVWSDNIDAEFQDTFFEDLTSLSPIYQKIIDSKKKIKFLLPLNTSESCCHLGTNNSFFIRPNGEIHKCTILFEDPNNIVGNLVNGKMVLNDKYYSKNLNPNMCAELYDCFYAPLCKGEVCPAKRSEKTECPSSKSILGYYLQLLDNYETFDVVDEGEII